MIKVTAITNPSGCGVYIPEREWRRLVAALPKEIADAKAKAERKRAEIEGIVHAEVEELCRQLREAIPQMVEIATETEWQEELDKTVTIESDSPEKLCVDDFSCALEHEGINLWRCDRVEIELGPLLSIATMGIN